MFTDQSGQNPDIKENLIQNYAQSELLPSAHDAKYLPFGLKSKPSTKPL
jgi:hypothetical protein